MKIDVNVFLHNGDVGLEGKLDQVISLLNALQTQGTKIMSAVDDLKAAVAAEDNEIAQALVFIQGVPALLAAAVAAAQSGDAATLASITADIQAQTTAIGTALAPAVPPAP